MPKTAWDATFYDEQHAFVSKYGFDLLVLLKPKKGEYILDLGCGTGVLTNEIAKLGAKVIGIDSSSEMINKAIANFRLIDFQVADGENFHFDHLDFDAVFSNAALHWMQHPEKVIACVWRCLKKDGRFVLEMGGFGNLQRLLYAVKQAAAEQGIIHLSLNNYFPKLGEYVTLLEAKGFCVTYAELIDRPTCLENEEGLRHWIRMFRSTVLEKIPIHQQTAFFKTVEDIARPHLYRDNKWWADYIRLRIKAFKKLT